eukprot:TRINITY_DN11253_c0_g1_i1.p1 TRINITY_DN11253_c0_g1~~TRINITY_DN11253_c0_g1_i1.p1  ORF type:complete len:1100 (+),score=215.98 TRINITY_DN11253_c0_g1_i1:51-3302(+)
MANADIVAYLKELMKGLEDPIRKKCIRKAITSVEKYPLRLEGSDARDLAGIGDWLADKIIEFLRSGRANAPDISIQTESIDSAYELLSQHATGITTTTQRTLSSFKLPELRQKCKEALLPTAGNKSEIIERLMAAGRGQESDIARQPAQPPPSQITNNPSTSGTKASTKPKAKPSRKYTDLSDNGTYPRIRPGSASFAFVRALHICGGEMTQSDLFAAAQVHTSAKLSTKRYHESTDSQQQWYQGGSHSLHSTLVKQSIVELCAGNCYKLTSFGQEFANHIDRVLGSLHRQQLPPQPPQQQQPPHAATSASVPTTRQQPPPQPPLQSQPGQQQSVSSTGDPNDFSDLNLSTFGSQFCHQATTTNTVSTKSVNEPNNISPKQSDDSTQSSITSLGLRDLDLSKFGSQLLQTPRHTFSSDIQTDVIVTPDRILRKYTKLNSEGGREDVRNSDSNPEPDIVTPERLQKPALEKKTAAQSSPLERPLDPIPNVDTSDSQECTSDRLLKKYTTQRAEGEAVKRQKVSDDKRDDQHSNRNTEPDPETLPDQGTITPKRLPATLLPDSENRLREAIKRSLQPEPTAPRTLEEEDHLTQLAIRMSMEEVNNTKRSQLLSPESQQIVRPLMDDDRLASNEVKRVKTDRMSNGSNLFEETDVDDSSSFDDAIAWLDELSDAEEELPAKNSDSCPSDLPKSELPDSIDFGYSYSQLPAGTSNDDDDDEGEGDGGSDTVPSSTKSPAANSVSRLEVDAEDQKVSSDRQTPDVPKSGSGKTVVTPHVSRTTRVDWRVFKGGRNSSRRSNPSNQSRIILLIDTRERKDGDRERFYSKLTSKGVACERRQLVLGDFLWVKRDGDDRANETVLDVIVERKQVWDLASSILSGRYNDQKRRLLQCGLKRPIYLLEGKSTNQQKLPAASLDTSLLTTSLFDGISVAQTASFSETIEFLSEMHFHLVASGGCVGDTPVTTPFIGGGVQQQTYHNECLYSDWSKSMNDESKHTTRDNIFPSQLSCIRGVGPDAAQAVAQVHPTTLSLFNSFHELVAAGRPAASELSLSTIPVTSSRSSRIRFVGDSVSSAIFRSIYNLCNDDY